MKGQPRQQSAKLMTQLEDICSWFYKQAACKGNALDGALLEDAHFQYSSDRYFGGLFATFGVFFLALWPFFSSSRAFLGCWTEFIFVWAVLRTMDTPTKC